MSFAYLSVVGNKLLRTESHSEFAVELLLPFSLPSAAGKNLAWKVFNFCLARIVQHTNVSPVSHGWHCSYLRCRTQAAASLLLVLLLCH